MKTTQAKGEYAELRMRLRAAEKGWLVSTAPPSARYDAILDDGKRLWRIQVKYTNAKAANSDGAICVNLRKFPGAKWTKVRNYKRGEVDAVVVYLPKTDKLYWLPIALVHNMPAITLRIAPPKNNNRNVHMASKYEW